MPALDGGRVIPPAPNSGAGGASTSPRTAVCSSASGLPPMQSGIRAGAMARPPRIRTPAIAYVRTSSAANVGADKGSDKRQRDAIAAYAKHAGFAVVDTYYDAEIGRAHV